MDLEQSKSQYLELSLKLPTAYSHLLHQLRTLVIGYAQCQGVHDQGYMAYRNYGHVVWSFMQGYVEANTELRPRPPYTELDDQVYRTAHLAIQLEIIHEYLKYKQMNGYYAGHCLEAEFMCYVINSFLADDVNRLKVEVSRHKWGGGKIPNTTSCIKPMYAYQSGIPPRRLLAPDKLPICSNRCLVVTVQVRGKYFPVKKNQKQPILFIFVYTTSNVGFTLVCFV